MRIGNFDPHQEKINKLEFIEEKMKIEIKEVIDKKEKEEISKEVLYDLPEWFGLPESTENYIIDS